MSKAGWTDLLKDYYGKQWAADGQEPSRWMYEIRKLFPDVSDGEICDAIRNRHNVDEKVYGQPDLNDMIRWLKTWLGTPTKTPRVTSDETYARYKDRVVTNAFRQIDAATEPHEVWAAIFSASSLDPNCGARAQIDAYAKRKKTHLYHFYDGKSLDDALGGIGEKIGGDKRDWTKKEPVCKNGMARQPGEEG